MDIAVGQPIDDPEEIIEVITSSIGNSFSLEELIRVIQKVFAEKPIHIEYVCLAPDITGRTYNLLDAVVIHVNRQLDRDHAQCVVCHEIGHVVFNHVKLEPFTYDQFKVEESAGRLDKIFAIYRQHRLIFDAPKEQSAEDLGLLLIECIERWENSLPDLAQDIFYSDD